MIFLDFHELEFGWCNGTKINQVKYYETALILRLNCRVDLLNLVCWVPEALKPLLHMSIFPFFRQAEQNERYMYGVTRLCQLNIFYHTHKATLKGSFHHKY